MIAASVFSSCEFHLMKNYLTRLTRADRRDFLKSALAATGSVAALSAGPAAYAGSPNDRLNLAIVGTGGMGSGHLAWHADRPDVQVVAVCDVDASHLQAAQGRVPDAFASPDFRQVVTRDDVDAVVVATPDHWHALAAVAAANAGKHIYCEKPLANSVGEGRAIADAVKRNGVILQTGSHERSNRGASIAKQVVDGGRLGKVHTVQIRLPNADAHLQEVENFTTPPPDRDPPPELDWNFWLGHTPVVPYNEKRCHFFWRFHSAYGGGEITDRGAHVIDLAHYILGFDDSGPVHVSAVGKPPAGNFYDAFITFQFENEYPGGLKMIGDNSGPRGLSLIGDEGKLDIAVHGCALNAEPSSLLDGLDAPGGEAYSVHRSGWLAAIRGGAPVVAPAEAGHRTATACHLNNIAMRLGKSFDWDPATEQSPDAEVNAQLMPQMRSPWSLQA
ncbi:MAG: Gfo/Idh/MocA family oxidoreductase [Planctomycetales bacterium]|nr:Gfo/Idh/MocA family oxidoreductase [Planctomycetales bacterium]